MSGDVEQEYFADGVVEDIITALSRFRSFAVIARNSSFVYKGRATDVRQVAHELGVRYVLEGSIRRAGTRLRITAQLVEGATGAHSGPSTMMDRQRIFLTSRIALLKASWPSSSRKSRAPRSPFRGGSARRASRHMTSIFRRWEASIPTSRTGTAPGSRLSTGHRSRTEQCDLPRGRSGAADAARRPGAGPAPTTIGQSVRTTSKRALAHGHGDATVLGILRQRFDPLPAGVRPWFRAGPTGGRHQSQQPRCGQFRRSCSLHCGSLDEAVTYFLRAERLSPNGLGSHWNLTGLAHVELVRNNYEQALIWAGKSMAANASMAHASGC